MKNILAFLRRKFKAHLYLAIAYRLLLVFVLFQACRLLFYYFNIDFFREITPGTMLTIMAGGSRFDLTALLYINMLFLLLSLIPFHFTRNKNYQKVLMYLFFVTNGFAIALNFIDFIYYPFTFKRTTLSVFEEFSNNSNLLSLLYLFIVDYWYVFLVFVLLILAMIYLYQRVEVSPSKQMRPIVFYPLYTAGLLLSAYFIIIGMRGGFDRTTRPISLSNAAKYADEPKQINLVLNTPFALLRTYNKMVLQKKDFFSASELAKYYNPVKLPLSDEAFSKKNVVIITLESFGREYMGFYERGNPDHQGYTPFLDSLLEHSLTFEHTFSNGLKSIDMLPSVVCSIPHIIDPYVVSNYSGNSVTSLAELVGEKGYTTAFIYGGPNGSMGYEGFTNYIGYDLYYGKNEYNNDEDYDGAWGIWDDKFLPYAAETITELKEPFFANVFSLSSHHPFKIPERAENKFKQGPLPIHQCIGYTDDALRQFFGKAAKQPWFENTLFVITADHTSVSQYPRYKTSAGVFKVPIAFYDPGNSSMAKLEDRVVQHIDIMPSILGYLNYDKPYVAFGNDVFNGEQAFAVHHINQNYQLIMEDYLLLFDGEKSGKLYNFKEDPLFEKDLLNEEQEVANRLTNTIKAFIQEYNNRMIEDRLTSADYFQQAVTQK